MKKTIQLLTLIFIMLMSSCEKDSNTKTPENLTDADIYGVIQKGPFVRGSKVTITELDENLNMTGKTYTTQIKNNKGEFAISNIGLKSDYVQIIVDGYFFNEVTGKLSDSQLMLTAISDTKSKHTMNVNILTHLENDRVLELVQKEGKSYTEAKKQALKEVLSAFYINEEVHNSESFDLSTNTKESQMLLAISSILINNRKESELTQFLSIISEDIADNGAIDNDETKKTISQNSMDMYKWYDIKYIESEKFECKNPYQAIQKVKINTKTKYKEFGIDINVENFEKYIDEDGDGDLSNNKTIDLSNVKFNNITDGTKTDSIYFSNEITLDNINRDILAWLPTLFLNYKNKDDIVTYNANGGSCGITDRFNKNVYNRILSKYNINKKYSNTFKTNFINYNDYNEDEDFNKTVGEKYYTYLSNGLLIAKYAGNIYKGSTKLSSISFAKPNYQLFVNDKIVYILPDDEKSTLWLHKGDKIKIGINPYHFFIDEDMDNKMDNEKEYAKYNSKYSPYWGTEIIPDDFYSGKTAQATIFLEGKRFDFSVSVK